MPNNLLSECAQPLFYYFLRRTGQVAEAEDLAADVLTAYLAAREKTIAHPHGWIWRVAANRYAAWAEEKRRGGSALDMAAPDLADLTAPDPLSEVIRTENLALLRRELAFIRREHRELIVAHYLQGERLRDIAVRLGVPIGTVKARLSRCRAKIKEGMDMARTFGPRSYNPENLDFVTSGNQPTDLPDRAMRRRLALNILLEASENPSTVEALSMALGVAVPYMEDEVRDLTQATLLKQVGERYVTSFYIMPCEVASLLRRTLRAGAQVHTALVRQIAREVLPLLRRIAPDTARRSDSELLWWLLPWVHEAALFAEPRYICDLPERPCGPDETWTIVGFEQTEAPDWEPCFLGRCVSCTQCGQAGIYKYDHPCEALWERVGALNEAQAALLQSLKAEGRSLSSLTATEQSAWASIDGRYAHAEGDRPVLDIILLTPSGRKAMDAAITGHPRFGALQEAVRNDMDRLLVLLAPRLGDPLRDQLNCVASHELVNLRMMVLNDCLTDGTLTLPERPEQSTIGIWLEMK